ncbi:NTP/NDP exchange transporter [Herbaspirillum sp. GCM10030257]|uniref:NTP/NDP exchange transporter n=1 Tax=Herbaspirillum sp. GCM10030257 TaxID=3273393 RepID=UPI00361EA219
MKHSTSMPDGPKGLRTVLQHEWLRTSYAALAFFLLLSSYTMLRPVRDDMAVRFGADRLHWLFTGTFLCTLAVIPLFGAVVHHVRRNAILPVCYGFLIMNLLGFCAAFRAEGNAWTAAAFFIWLSVFNLFVVSLFWSNVSDAFNAQEAQRRYGMIAAGGTVGAMAGPAMTALVARYVSTSTLLATSAGLLFLATLCMIALRKASPGDNVTSLRPVGGSIVAGVPLTLKMPELRGIALLVICLTTVSTVLYVEIISLAGQHYASSGERKTFFASVDLVVNLLAFGLQLAGTRFVVRHAGLVLALSIAPVLMLAGLVVLGVWPTLIGFAAVQVLHRASEYAFGKPGREMIYTTIGPEGRFKAKNFIDTTVYRANDAASAWLINLVRGVGWSAVLLVGLPAVLVWLVAAFRTGISFDRRTDK